MQGVFPPVKRSVKTRNIDSGQVPLKKKGRIGMESGF
jgi:hypothetical protein